MNDTIDSLAIRMALKLNKIEENLASKPPEKIEKSCFKKIFIRLFKSKMYFINQIGSSITL